MGIKKLTEKLRYLMGEKNPLVKFHVPSDEFHGEIFRLRAGTDGTLMGS